MKQWYINQMDCKPKDGNLTDFVVTVYWERKSKDKINDKEYFASVFGNQTYSVEDVTNFIPYDQLTYEIVCGWLDNSIDIVPLDLKLDELIQSQLNPPIVTPPLPFVNP